MINNRWLPFASLIMCLLFASTSSAATEDKEMVEHLFEYGTEWRGEHYVRIRDALINKSEAIIPFLESKTKSTSNKEKLFADILINRIKQPQTVEKWQNNLMSPVKEYKVLEAVKNCEIDGNNFPQKAADVPVSHLVDVLWQRNRREEELTAAALQFYLKPDIQAVDAVMEALPDNIALWNLSKFSLVKLGNHVFPQMRDALAKTVEMQNSAPWESQDIALREQYFRQVRKVQVAAYVLSKLNDRTSIPLIAKCLTIYTHDYTDIEAISEYLAFMKAVEAVIPMLEVTLKSALKRSYKGNGGNPGYAVLRSHLKSLGRQALPALKERLNSTDKDGEKIVLTNLIAEMTSVNGKEKKIAELRESLWFNTATADLIKLHELTGEDIFPRLTELILYGHKSIYGTVHEVDEKTAACLALGTLKEVRAVPLLAEELRKQHQYLEQKLIERKANQDAKPIDPQKIREAGYAYRQMETDLAQILSWGDTCLLALRRIGSDEAKKVVTKVAEYPEYKVRAKISLLLMEHKNDDIVKYLNSDITEFREEAALALWEVKDKRSTLQLLSAAARRQGPSHEQWKEYALSSRKNILPVLSELTDSNSARERILGSAMTIEIKYPDKAKKCYELLRKATSNVSMMRAYHIGMVKSEGCKLAGELDESYVPLLEAKCVFGRGVIYRGIAAFALAEFKKPSSMYTLAESFNMGSLNGSNPAALALAEYGEEGAELAAKVPNPLPGEFDTGLQMTRHRAAVTVLAEQQDIKGVEEILKGLNTLRADRSLDNWNHRMGIYLDAAGKFYDERLIEPLLQILKSDDKLESYHNAQVINLLSAYDDERLVPMFTQFLGAFGPDKYNPAQESLYGPALTALTRRLGDETPEYLVKQFNLSNNDKIKAGVLLALGELSYPDNPPYPGKSRWSIERFNKKEDREEIASKARKLAYPILIKSLKEQPADINRMAALGLTILATGNKYDPTESDQQAVGPLTEWLKMQKESFYSLTIFLSDNGNVESGKALLNILKSQPPTGGDAHTVFALRKLKPEGTVPVLVRNVKAKAIKNTWIKAPELEALAAFGKEGADSLLEIFNSVDNLEFRIEAAKFLSEVGNKNAVAPIAALLEKVIKAGAQNPELILWFETREKAYVRCCGTLLEALAKLDRRLAQNQAQNILLNGPDELRQNAMKVWTDTTKTSGTL